MTISVFDLFKIGVGPSSSHTMGPMTAAFRFTARLARTGWLDHTDRVIVTLYASLALTGRGHATDSAVITGLAGHQPADVDPDAAETLVAGVTAHHRLPLGGTREIIFDPGRDIEWRGGERLPFHPNGMLLRAFDADGTLVAARTYYSIGGGFVLDEDEARLNQEAGNGTTPPPHYYETADGLLSIAATTGLSIPDIILANECARQTETEVRAGLDTIWAAMEACINRGIRQDGLLPGGLKVKRRAGRLHRDLLARQERMLTDPLSVLDWINLWALAVNEENAAGGKVVTSPTNGAAGVVPAVLRYYDRFCNGTREGRHRFLLTAAAIGGLYKRNASISAAEVGCQGEVGVACSMAAGALVAALGGSAAQIENAAEIGMEHNLGLTCDPIGGLVQIPCIERNAMGAIKAVDASRLAMMGDGSHHVSLDRVIETMRRTGADMSEHYKETSLGGLAVNVPEC
ncbi:L-serine ammonia-lyase [Niveispirillum sp.]|uniref:L-serine ammonia-lyase n=1 Tax=Niveispirillum sp. TaxID=1917217 RepID=UPI001B651BCD|nr:L-serine ammonia-lyase [Niveispirillum sp.]MBP7336935.1 L-serine ammonia-lyase [Niveispirillum sp.]